MENPANKADERKIRDALDCIRIWHRGGQRAPHKPLLLLLALARIQRGQPRLVPFPEIEPKLRKLLEAFGPDRKSHHPEYPFWRLQNDGLWEIPGGQDLRTRLSNTDPPPTELRKVSGGFPEDFDMLLRRRPALVRQLVQSVLEEHFPSSYREDLLAATGLNLQESRSRSSGVRDVADENPRDPAFRDRILNTYGYRCAVCGLDPLVDGTVIGLEAAHIHWHSHGGPSSQDNGLCLCPLHHKALDLGVLGMSPDRQIQVSSRLNGSDVVEGFIGRFHARPIAKPLHGGLPIHEDFRMWHERNVFKHPARPA